MIDIGAWDGFFSFARERRGAAKVVAAEFLSLDAERDRF